MISSSFYKADDGARTRDLRLGKPTLYQLSYVRKRPGNASDCGMTAPGRRPADVAGGRAGPRWFATTGARGMRGRGRFVVHPLA